MPLSTMTSISNLKILDEDGKEGELDDNKPIEVDMPTPIFMEKLKAEAARERLHIAKEQVQLKVDILQQRVQLL